MAAEITAVRAATAEPFGVNVLVPGQPYPDTGAGIPDVGASIPDAGAGIPGGGPKLRSAWGKPEV